MKTFSHSTRLAPSYLLSASVVGLCHSAVATRDFKYIVHRISILKQGSAKFSVNGTWQLLWALWTKWSLFQLLRLYYVRQYQGGNNLKVSFKHLTHLVSVHYLRMFSSVMDFVFQGFLYSASPEGNAPLNFLLVSHLQTSTHQLPSPSAVPVITCHSIISRELLMKC